jgi:hypothetical protein
MASRIPILGSIFAALLAAACSPSPAPDAPDAAPASVAAAPVALPTMTVYKTPTCGCCKNWVEHVQQAGINVEVHDLPDLTEIKNEAGVPADARSCHTAIVDGYTIEGHVPAAAIKRLLQERPAVAGLAVPGMPVGSPGMEVPGQAPDRYDVIAFQRDGSSSVFESH